METCIMLTRLSPEAVSDTTETWVATKRDRFVQPAREVA